ncbi:MAG: hypothetical protein A2284_11765 [Deltaproteobacteria bacterium RIFOXYA12_FULL_61_11]|nr:MAG: hypothetical protein A2284_11765 [Deltaproteobacteria bacterium RIFOXYA12_FULL_61_11]
MKRDLGLLLGLSVWSLLAWSAGEEPAPATDGPDCKTCHREVSSSPHLHTPIEEGECSACHVNEHRQTPEAGHRFDLAEGGGTALCLACHDDLVETVHREGIHPPVAEDCLACHRPHGSTSSHALLREATIGATCLSCHEDLAPAPFLHGGKGDCTSCHRAKSAEKNLLLSPTQCTDRCHGLAEHGLSARHLAATTPENKDGLPRGPGNTISCTTCHTPHPGAAGRTVGTKPLTGPAGRIASLSPRRNSPRATMLRANGTADELCLRCHSDLILPGSQPSNGGGSHAAP